jgi:hypothetical protein
MKKKKSKEEKEFLLKKIIFKWKKIGEELILLFMK